MSFICSRETKIYFLLPENVPKSGAWMALEILKVHFYHSRDKPFRLAKVETYSLNWAQLNEIVEALGIG